ncbi:MAG: DEAD/DEAH box helicase [Caldilineaceae bacterium]
MSARKPPCPSNPSTNFYPPPAPGLPKTLGEPTPPQAQGWPAIQHGDHTLILAPTGSGKTLTAFLWGIDQLFRELMEVQSPESKVQNPQSTVSAKKARAAKPKPETRLLYISPLKALNNDIERNLRTPLAGIRQVARQMGAELPEVEVAVRSGDTPPRERQAMLRRPPHILITTPESLYLMLTSPKARDLFRLRAHGQDEIHTLAGSKRYAPVAQPGTFAKPARAALSSALGSPPPSSRWRKRPAFWAAMNGRMGFDRLSPQGIRSPQQMMIGGRACRSPARSPLSTRPTKRR